jgi:acetyl-CoA acetyltransferase
MYVNRDLLHTSSFLSADSMWKKTDLKPADVDVAGLYDGWTVHTLTWLEALGFCGVGESGWFVEEGNTKLGSKLPTNCDGGTINMGRLHGINHVIEVTRQLRGESGPRQTPGAEIGVAATGMNIYSGCMLLTKG